MGRFARGNLRAWLLAAATVVAVVAALPATAAAARITRLSDEKTLSRWAAPNTRAYVRVKPRGSARAVARLRYLTEDRRPEIYLALRSTKDPRGDDWVEIRLPQMPNGSTGWVRREALGPFQTVSTRLIVDRRALRATLYRRGRAIWTSRVGVGRVGRPTPAGRFYIRARLNSPYGGTIYGPLAFGTSAYSGLSDWPRGGVIGIHGTNEPGLIPGRISNGCIRVPNRNVVRLGRLMPVGTPLLVK